MAKLNRKLELISRADLARRKGVARSTVTRACNSFLRGAVSGDMVDAAHPAVRKWLTIGDDAPTAPGPNRASEPGAEGPTRDDFTSVTYRKKLAEAERLESRNARDAERLVARALVASNVFPHIDELTIRLLRDAGPTIAMRVHAAHGETLEHRREIALSILTQILKEAKRKTTAGLRNCGAGNNPPDVPETVPKTERDNTALLLVRRINHAMQGSVAAQLAEVAIKEFSRVAAGTPFDRVVFERVMSASASLADDLTRTFATIIVAHVDRASRAPEGL